MNYKTLLAMASLLFCLPMSSCGQEIADYTGNSLQQIRQANAALDAFGQQELRRSPETASRLGLTAQLSGFAHENLLDDRSQAAFERARLERLAMLERLSRLDLLRAPQDLKVSLTTSLSALRSLVDISEFGHGRASLGFARPYAADQLAGAYIDLPDLLINRQTIDNREEALAYLDRLAGLAGAIDDDRRRLLSDAKTGIVPPDFILLEMARLADTLAALPEVDPDAPEPVTPPVHGLVSAFDDLVLGIEDISGTELQRIRAEISRIVTVETLPAYARFRNALLELAREAPSAPGVWTLRNGEAYYQTALKFYTGQDLEPAALHQEGLRIVISLTAELDTALAGAGLAEGSVGERLAILNTRPDQVFPNDDAGRDALLASLAARITETRTALDRIIAEPPRTRVAVAEVPDFLAAHSPGGYYAAAPADNSAPAFFFINLRDTAEWPAYTLPTLLYHEAIPGHHLESSIIAERGRLPIIRQMIWLPAFGEGWALYAEDLADELGLYEDDPLGRIGYLQSLLFRAARLVTDTGIHDLKWSREDAVAYLVNVTGQSRSAMETEVDRYTVWPGQATAYMVGRQFIWKLRRDSQRALGRDFDLRAFHEIILGQGPRPLDMVQADVEAWVDRIAKD